AAPAVPCGGAATKTSPASAPASAVAASPHCDRDATIGFRSSRLPLRKGKLERSAAARNRLAPDARNPRLSRNRGFRERQGEGRALLREALDPVEIGLVQAHRRVGV